MVQKYQPQVVFDLHEDPDESKFYLYFQGKEFRTVAEKIVRLVSFPFYKRKIIQGDLIINGIIENGTPGKSFDDFLERINIPSFCIETPGLFLLKDRIKVYEKIIDFIVS